MNKLAIVGTAPSGASAPFKDLSYDIWGVGKPLDYVTRATRWYELHRLDGEVPAWAFEWRKLMREQASKCPIWMFYPEQDLGHEIVQMDPQPLIDKYGTFFMTSSFSWMIAQAIEEGYREIGLWGVDMEYGTEYRQQRVGLRHFIQVAKLQGVSVQRVVSSGIAYEPIPYPMWMDDPLLSKNALRQKRIQENMEQSRFVADGMVVKLQQAEGARQQALELSRSDNPALREYGVAQADRLLRTQESIRAGLDSARNDQMKAEGALEELRWLQDYLQP